MGDRRGAYFALQTLPKSTSSTASGLIPALSTAAAECQYCSDPNCLFIPRHTFDGVRAKLDCSKA